MPFGVFRAGGRGGRFIRHSTDCDEHCNLIQWMCVCACMETNPIQTKVFDYIQGVPMSSATLDFDLLRD